MNALRKNSALKPGKVSPKAIPNITGKKSTLIPELAQLEKTVGQFMVYWGFKSIHGRIWLHLYLSKTPLDSAELMSRLKVSKGLMSTAVRTLLQYKVIQPVETGRHGTVFYEANPDLQNVITGVLRSRERMMLDLALVCSQRLSEIDRDELNDFGLSAERIQSVKAMTDTALGVLNAFLLMKQSSPGFECQNIFQKQNLESEW